ncbi:alpha-mannosidase-like [Vigna radiata var. radiata]|uniref:Alpha-mannosidase-like n=1 Tax=Vigna radiata var. radiata TaxID=3916 RepID=A0A3Q0F8W6_VIGRR|nr:alpha-mannosidase-like [Vigna radiata var. radiata]
MTTNMATNKEFYTDSNDRDFLKRVRDHRDDWPLQVTQPVAGNYYPINLGIYTKDKKSEFSVLVDRATGGASIKDGEVELMLHNQNQTAKHTAMERKSPRQTTNRGALLK